MTPRKSYLPDTRLVCTWSHRDYDSTHQTCTSSSQTKCQQEEEVHTKCYLQLISAGKEKKNSFLRCVGYNSSTLQGKPHAHEQLTNTEWTQWYFCGLCCFITLYCQFLNFYSALIFNFYFAYILTTVFPSSTSPCPFLHFLSLPWSTPPPFLFNKRQTS